MNQQIRELVEQSGLDVYGLGLDRQKWENSLTNFVELLKHDIYNQVREELVDDAHIDAKNDVEDRCYLRGNNGGIVDALCIIKNFGQDIET